MYSAHLRQLADFFLIRRSHPRNAPGRWDDVFGSGQQNQAGGFMPAAKQAIGAGIKGLGQAATDFIPGVEKGNALSSYGQSVIDANPTAIRSLGDIADKPLKAITEATGNAGGSMASMLGARGVGMAMTAAAPFTGPAAPIVAGAGQLIANVGPFVAAALPSYGGIRGSQIAADPLNEQDGRSKAIALLGAGTVGAIEGSFGPQAWALAAMKKGGIEAVAKNFAAAKSLPGFIGKGALKGAAVEGAEELVQNPVEQIASYQDPTTGESISDTALQRRNGRYRRRRAWRQHGRRFVWLSRAAANNATAASTATCRATVRANGQGGSHGAAVRGC
jgi:hypothetical protein